MAQSGRVLVFNSPRTITRRASFASVEQSRDHIDAFVEAYNKTAEPFEWIKSKVYQRRVKGRRLSDL